MWCEQVHEILSGGCILRNTWLRKYGTLPSVVSMVAAADSHLYILNRYDFQRAMALSEGHDLLAQVLSTPYQPLNYQGFFWFFFPGLSIRNSHGFAN